MNFNKFINSDYLKSNPLCGIDTYKDELNLATGACTRHIKKLVLTGEEDISLQSINSYGIANFYIYIPTTKRYAVCTHFKQQTSNISNTQDEGFLVASASGNRITFYIRIFSTTASTNEELQTYLAAQYAAGTPVTIWYVLAEPTTETITVPSGLTGTVEGYLNQSGTPTPTNPIYPTANTVEQWLDLNHYIMGTSTDTITTLPAVLYPNDTTATVGIKGNTIQNGTPTPSSPVAVNGVGERTGNLFDVSTVEKGRIDNGEVGFVSQTSSLTIEGGTVSFTTTATYRGVCSGFFEIPEGTETITFNFIRNEALGAKFVFYDSAKIWLDQDYAPVLSDIPPATANVPSGAKYVRISFTGQIVGGYSYTMSNLMLNLGSEALPYEPYGQYKIPISSAGQTTPVYLGEVQTTRKIKKIVFTGSDSEGWTNQILQRKVVSFPKPSGVPAGTSRIISSHFVTVQTINPAIGELYVGGSWINFNYDNDNDLDIWKAYLAQQYAAGTPVTIWYVLNDPETGTVNEPLMKIGDYADSISDAATIPTAKGTNTLTVGTTVQPSEVTVNYKGWHPVADVHEHYTIATMQALTIAQLQTHTISELEGGEWS